MLGLWCFIGAIGVIGWVAAHLPPIQSLEVPKRPPSIQIVGLNGRVLATRGEMGGSAVPLRELPPFLPKAFLAIEDRRFYSHYGVDPFGVARAVGANVLHRGVSQGGSTITQQLAKNLFLTQERTMQRKLQEVILAFWLERKYSKDEILDLYLNRVYFGSGAYGVEAAAQRYFGKSARNVTLSEAALLAGLVKSPSKLAPTRNFDGAERRAQIVLAAMSDAGYVIGRTPPRPRSTIAPKIVKQTRRRLDQLRRRLGDGRARRRGRARRAGHRGRDHDRSRRCRRRPRRRCSTNSPPKGAKFDVEQGALVAMTPQGAVRALVGGKNYAESQFNRAVAAKRQPGSAFKPFVYLTALERGLTPDTMREDKPIDVKGWKPENYSHEYFGPVSLHQGAGAVAQHRVGAPHARGRAAGGGAHRAPPRHRLEARAERLDRARHLGSLRDGAGLGLCAVRQWRHRGRAARDRASVRTAGGKLIYRARNPGLGRVIDERTRRDDEPDDAGDARDRHRRARPTLAGFPAAGKTGTSQDFRDAWFIGYTGHLVAGVWLGNDDNSPTKKLTGGGMPVDIWSRFMKAAHQGLPMADLPGMAGRTIEPVPQRPRRLPSCGARKPAHLDAVADAGRTPLSREDDMRPLSPRRVAAVAAAPQPPRASRVAPQQAQVVRDRCAHPLRPAASAAAAALQSRAATPQPSAPAAADRSRRCRCQTCRVRPARSARSRSGRRRHQSRTCSGQTASFG